MSPEVEIDMDLIELKKPFLKAKRVFLTGANPIGLSFYKLKTIGEKIKSFLPHIESVGGFARISDIKNKTQDELSKLYSIGYNYISIGTETGDDITLAYMNKGYTASDIVEQLHRLDNAGIKYHLTYLNGLSGSGNTERNALESAKIFNKSNPQSINIVGLTIFPESELYKEVNAGKYIPASETEKLYELQNFIKNIDITTTINANTVSNTAPFVAKLPKDKDDVLEALQGIINRFDEGILSNYRNSIVSL